MYMGYTLNVAVCSRLTESASRVRTDGTVYKRIHCRYDTILYCNCLASLVNRVPRVVKACRNNVAWRHVDEVVQLTATCWQGAFLALFVWPTITFLCRRPGHITGFGCPYVHLSVSHGLLTR